MSEDAVADVLQVRQQKVQELALLGLVFLAYVAVGKFGLQLAFVNASATAVWPAAGLSLTAFLILGDRAWPAIFLGAFAVNVTTAGTLVTSLGIAAGNTCEGLLGGYLVRRYAAGRRALENGRDVFVFVVVAALFSTTVSATCGVTSLALSGFARWEAFGSIWLTWWLGDAAGILVFAPVVLHWINHPRVRWTRRQAIEAVAVLFGLVLVGMVVFGGLIPSHDKNYPLEFLCVPLLIWAAYRLGAREAATAIAVLSGVAIWGTLRGLGPFARPNQNESLLLLQGFMGVKSVSILILAAVVGERNRVEEQLRVLAVTDPLTGLANYRQLIAVLETEIRRSQRTGRPFAAMLLDVDRLKTINDRHGHLVGSRALCRVADALRRSCRSTDTPARYGGDEFAVILPETPEAAALQIAERTSKQLASDGESPPVTVSLGVSLFPRDGKTAEQLLSAADHALYGMKGRRVGPPG